MADEQLFPTETVADGDSTGSTKAAYSLFENLGAAGSSDSGRNQLTDAQRNAFAQPLADAARIPRRNISIRALNDDKQTGRAAAETIAERVKSNVEMLDWLFVGRCTGAEDTYSTIMRYMGEHAHYLAGISLFIGAQPKWRVLGIFYDKELKEVAQRISEFLDYDFSQAIEIHVRDRRNLTKNISDYNDPVADGVFLSDDERRRILNELMRKKCIVLQGPPGTGKTVIGKSISLQVARNEERILNLQFHQSYSYEDFVRGWRPGKDGELKIVDGAFLEFCKVASESPAEPFVVFIDEINRANISQVFGEVLSLVEATKRDRKFAVHLSYQVEGGDFEFFIPQNIFIIATMNTADRSLAVVDFALRRRFSFLSVDPAFGTEDFYKFVESNGLPKELAEEISNRFFRLNEAIVSDTRSLGSGFELGHSYFCGKVPVGVSPSDWYQSIIQNEIAPLLYEYWIDDGEKAQEQIASLSRPFSMKELEIGTPSVMPKGE